MAPDKNNDISSTNLVHAACPRIENVCIRWPIALSRSTIIVSIVVIMNSFFTVLCVSILVMYYQSAMYCRALVN